MNTKLICATAATAIIASTAIVWSCTSSPDQGDSEAAAAAFRGFNEPMSGAIFTTLSDGSAVNANIYQNKDDVYLDGGPGIHAPAHAAGLPEGDYYFQITDPSGQDLLSQDHISCRMVHVNDAGVIARAYPGTDYQWRGGGWIEVPCQHQTGIDQDHSADGAITVQLMPYDNTPNPGGVYKVWMTPVGEYTGDPNFVPQSRPDEVNGELWEPGNFHGFVPAHSKTDNFKVKKGGKPQTLTVRKFHDANANGIMDELEAEITGWGFSVNDPTGSGNRYFTPETVLVHEGLWAVLEDMPAGSMITASYLDSAQLSVYPSADPLVLVEVAGLGGEHHEVLYGDIGIGKIEVCKIYDADGDGEVDTDEPTVPGWSFQLAGTDVRGSSVGPIVQSTGLDGCTTFTELLPGSYRVSELSLGGDWVASGPGAQSFEIASTLIGSVLSGTHVEASFTNYCKGTADFGTKGYWHNKNGLAEMSDSDIDYANDLAPYAAPSSYFEAGDEPFDGMFADGSPVEAAFESSELLAPAGSARAEVSQFLIGSNRDADPREQLAQQLLAFTFNLLNRVDGVDASLQMPDGSFMSGRALMDQAISAWEGEDAAAQTAIKDTLDALNNSDAVVFIYASPCALP